MKYDIPFIKPSMPKWSEMVDYYEEIIENNWFTNFGPLEERFRLRVEEFLNNGAKVTTVANATLGLDLAIKALFKKKSNAKDVIMPSFTFAAGANVLISNGFRPIFIDIDKKTWQMNIEKAEAYIKDNAEKIVGILHCNIFGVADSRIGQWEVIAKKLKIPLIVDSAAGFGSQYANGECLGSRGDCEIFSMHATKPFGVGEGGLVCSKSLELINKIRQLQNFGFDRNRRVCEIGTNAKLQEINCALGLKQLENYRTRLDYRRTVLDYYKAELSDHGFAFQPNDNLSAVPFASVLAPDINSCQAAIGRLTDARVETRSYYAPLHLQPSIKKLSKKTGYLEATEDIASKIISLPVHDQMKKTSMLKIVKAIKGFRNNAKTQS